MAALSPRQKELLEADFIQQLAEDPDRDPNLSRAARSADVNRKTARTYLSKFKAQLQRRARELVGADEVRKRMLDEGGRTDAARQLADEAANVRNVRVA